MTKTFPYYLVARHPLDIEGREYKPGECIRTLGGRVRRFYTSDGAYKAWRDYELRTAIAVTMFPENYY